VPVAIDIDIDDGDLIEAIRPDDSKAELLQMPDSCLHVRWAHEADARQVLIRTEGLVGTVPRVSLDAAGILPLDRLAPHDHADRLQ
jgi:hypothetical protein